MYIMLFEVKMRRVCWVYCMGMHFPVSIGIAVYQIWTLLLSYKQYQLSRLKRISVSGQIIYSFDLLILSLNTEYAELLIFSSKLYVQIQESRLILKIIDCLTLNAQMEGQSLKRWFFVCFLFFCWIFLVNGFFTRKTWENKPS